MSSKSATNKRWTSNDRYATGWNRIFGTRENVPSADDSSSESEEKAMGGAIVILMIPVDTGMEGRAQTATSEMLN